MLFINYQTSAQEPHLSQLLSWIWARQGFRPKRPPPAPSQGLSKFFPRLGPQYGRGYVAM